MKRPQTCFKGVQFLHQIKSIFDYFHSQMTNVFSKKNKQTNDLLLRQVIFAEIRSKLFMYFYYFKPGGTGCRGTTQTGSGANNRRDTILQ